MISVAEDLETLLNAITFTTITPNIRMIHANKDAYSQAELIIGEWALNSLNNVGGSKKFANYTIQVELTVNDATTTTDIRQIITDIQDQFDTDNTTSPRSYYWELLLTNNNIVKSASINLDIRVRQLP